MRRNAETSIFLIWFLFTLTAQTVFTQISAADKIVLARFEKSIEQGKLTEIERPLLDFAVAHPNDANTLELLALLRYRQNRPSEAESLFRRVLTLAPDSADAKIYLARIADESGRTDAARQMLNEIRLSEVAADAIRLDLANAFLSVGDFQKALQTTEKLSSKTRNSAALPLIAAIYIGTSERRKLNDLLPSMKKAATVNPVLAARCAEVLQSAGMNKEAVDLLGAALTTSPNDFDVLISLAIAETAGRDFPRAELHLNRAAKLKTRQPEILLARAMLEAAKGNPVAALEALKQARQVAPDSATILSQFVVAAMRANQAGAAFGAAKDLLALKPDDAEFQYLYGAAALQNGNFGEAQKSLEDFVLQRPRDSRGCLALGLTLAALPDRIDAARNQLTRCLEIDPKNYEAKYQLGLSYKAQGETAKAVPLLEDAVKIAPGYAPALRDLGALYLQSNEEAKARIVLEKAVALDAADADTHFQLSRLYNLIGEKALARQHLETFQKLRNQGAK